MQKKPLILLTNDDGIESPGLHALAEAVAELGDLLIVAPHTQQSGAGHSYPPVRDHTIHTHTLSLNGTAVTAYSAAVSPAQAVVLAALVLAPRPVDLCLSGINFGENLGAAVTTSGTVGAALEAVNFGIPALAVSLETPQEYHHTRDGREIDFSAAAGFARQFARQVLRHGLPQGVDMLKIDIPAPATPQTPWRATRLSRQRYYYPVRRAKTADNGGLIGYEARIDHATLEPDSDIHAVHVDRIVSVTPMTNDLTARIDPQLVAEFLSKNGESYPSQIPAARSRA